MLVLEHGKPMIFGKDRDKGIRLDGPASRGRDHRRRTASPRRTSWSTMRPPPSRTWRSCSRGCSWPDFPVPVGVLRAMSRPTHDRLIDDQLAGGGRQAPARATSSAVLNGGETWTVE